jgi:cytosine/adenosine deaminase-related metal-dependent hydrolase
MLLHDDVVDVWVELADGKVVDWGEGKEDADLEGWIIPPFVNAHTHVADSFLLDERKPATVAELVGPGGWKHQQLAKASSDDIEDGIFARTDEMGKVGTAHFIDFREGGIEGVKMLRQMASELRCEPVIFGREEAGETDWDQLAQEADGIGMSGLRDHTQTTLDESRAAAGRARKPFAIHASEDKRDDIDAIIALEPAFVVHMCQGTPSDFKALAEADIPIAICPRSNRYFGLPTPAREMLDAGVTVAIGTDNGMLADGDIRKELAILHTAGIKEESLLRMATHSGRFMLDLPATLPPRKGALLEAILLPYPAIPTGPSNRPRL